MSGPSWMLFSIRWFLALTFLESLPLISAFEAKQKAAGGCRVGWAIVGGMLVLVGAVGLIVVWFFFKKAPEEWEYDLEAVPDDG